MRSKVVIASGIWNLGLGIMMFVPPLYRALGLRLDQAGWGFLIGALLLFTAAVLVLAGKDVVRYGAVIVFEAGTRFLAAVILIPAGLLYGYGWLAVFAGVTDILWGVAYLVIVQRVTGRSISQLCAELIN